MPVEKHLEIMSQQFDITGAPMTAQMFGNAGIEHMRKYGTKPEHFAKIAQKNHKHSVNNPYAQFQDEYTLQQVQNSPQVHEFLTRLQCSPTSDGSAAAILANEAFVRRNRLESKAIEIVGMEMTTDPSTSFNGTMINAIGHDMTKLAADRLFAKAQIKPQNVDVIELHDCFSTNELITYEALGLCGPGEGGKLVDRGDNTYGGKYVINPSGGLISKVNSDLFNNKIWSQSKNFPSGISSKSSKFNQNTNLSHPGSSIGCNRLGPMCRAHMATAKRSRQTSSAGCKTRFAT